MTIASTDRKRPPLTARRAGYGIGAAINAVLLYLINGRPGWTVVPFLGDDTAAVLPWINASLIVGLVVSLVQLVRDPPWLVALGGMATAGIGAAATARMWQVFPFVFGSTSFNWALIVRILLVVGVAGSFAALVSNAVKLAASWPAEHHR
ncbi:hypothetical protein [Actinoplanes sp. NPDC020271]|uniref:hypothetical protein n=1 Tax=Actinoplanes sp. NPDC020271 TaxID=3363896 RepID=UPI0037955EAC